MLVSGQPKTTSEYIQATSRVGRDPGASGTRGDAAQRPQAARTVPTTNAFPAFHESFYRNVEATSVHAVLVPRAGPRIAGGHGRSGASRDRRTDAHPAARDVETHRAETDAIAGAVGERAQRHADGLPADAGRAVQRRVQSLLDDWAALAREAGEVGVTFGYAPRAERIRVHPAPARDDRPRSGYARRPAATLPRPALVAGRRAGCAARHQDARRPGQSIHDQLQISCP